MDTIYDELSRFSPDGLVHDNERLAELQALPLHRKIGITIARITEWYKAFNGNIYVSLSGGKDSTVLWDITHKLFPDVPAVFSNTGLEYPEIQQFAKSICTDVVSPKMSFTEVIKTYGYPLISKEVSEAIYYARRNAPPDAKQNGNDWSLQAADHKSVVKNIGQANNLEETRTYGTKTRPHKNGLLDNLPPPQDSQLIEREQNSTGNVRTPLVQKNVRRKMLTGSFANSDGSKKSAFNKEKWLPLVYLPFKISHYCCNVMKKSPLGIYQRQTNRYPVVGTMTEESRVRKQAWLRHGCNAFNSKKKLSAPLSFWTEQDILQYIKRFDVDICSVYGDIETLNDGQLHCTGCQRTGCVFCGFGCHLEKGADRRFLRLKETHPQLYDYCMRGGTWEDNPDYIPDLPEYDGEWRNWNPEKIFVPHKGLGLATVFDMINEIYGEDFIKYK